MCQYNQSPLQWPQSICVDEAGQLWDPSFEREFPGAHHQTGSRIWGSCFSWSPDTRSDPSVLVPTACCIHVNCPVGGYLGKVL